MVIKIGDVAADIQTFLTKAGQTTQSVASSQELFNQAMRDVSAVNQKMNIALGILAVGFLGLIFYKKRG